MAQQILAYDSRRILEERHRQIDRKVGEGAVNSNGEYKID